ncbi:MAG: hypothetical protein ABS904_00970 [Solibacillus isronensis]
MKLFISSDFNIINTRLGHALNLELSRGYVEQVITTNSKADSFIIDYCVAKGIEFKIFDLSLKNEPKAIEMICLEIDKIVLLSSMNNYFYLNLFREAEKWVSLPDGFKVSLAEVKSILKKNYKERVESGTVNSFKAYEQEILNPLKLLKKIDIVILDKGRH